MIKAHSDPVPGRRPNRPREFCHQVFHLSGDCGLRGDDRNAAPTSSRGPPAECLDSGLLDPEQRGAGENRRHRGKMPPFRRVGHCPHQPGRLAFHRGLDPVQVQDVHPEQQRRDHSCGGPATMFASRRQSSR